MIYNTIHHDIRNKANLSLIDYCLLDSIYNLCTSGKERYNTWCNAPKSSFEYLASDRTINTRLKHLESKGWIEFKDEKRFLKRTTKKYYNEVRAYVDGVKKFHHEETSPMKKLHPPHEETSPLSMKKLHPKHEEASPNKNNNDINNNIDKESKETPSQIELLKSELEKKEAEILELKIEKEKQRKKVALKKESSESYEGLSNFEIMDKRKENRNWTQLDTNFNGGFKMPKEWSDNLKNEVLGHWLYMDEKKGDRWGTTRTLSAQKDLITEWQKEFTELEIINALLDCQQRGNVTPNPLWTKNRKNKEMEREKETATQKNDDGTPSFMMGLQ